jgi:predicted DCC family thiol-disulfide oxidoreductase YuxK
MTRTLSVLYDADCGVCTWTARLLRRFDRHDRLRLIPLASASLPGQPPLETLLEQLHVMDSDGMWWAGADACIEIADRLAVLRPLVWPAAIPLARPLFGFGYRMVAGNRHRLGALLGLNTCPSPRSQTPAATGGRSH